jgi:hypothetical protein
MLPADFPSAIVDGAASARLRLAALGLGDGSDLSRCDDHQIVELLGAAVAQGRLAAGPVAAPQLLRLATAAPPTAAPPPPAAAPRAAAAAAAAPTVAETTFGAELDVAAMVAVLVQAAQDGVPFCEECARAAAAQQQAAA